MNYYEVEIQEGGTYPAYLLKSFIIPAVNEGDDYTVGDAWCYKRGLYNCTISIQELVNNG